VGSSEVVEQLLIGGGLFERVELLPVEVLQQRVAKHIGVRRLTDDRWDVLKARPLGRPPAALAHDELVVPVTDLPHHDRLEKPDLGDGGGQLFERLLVKGAARLARIRRDRADRDFLEVGTRDLAQSGVGSFVGSDRTPGLLIEADDVYRATHRPGGAETAWSGRGAGHRPGASAGCLRDQCSETLAETPPLLRHCFSWCSCPMSRTRTRLARSP
jgi:hypothetical protein